LHTDERREPCKGLQELSNCVYRLGLTLPDGTEVDGGSFAGCCVAERKGGLLFCSNPTSSEASPAAGVVTNTVRLQHACRGGELAVDERVTESDARKYGLELVCQTDTGFKRRCKRGATANCECMLGDVVDQRQFCRCTEPNEGARCSGPADCSGGGACAASSAWLEELAPEDEGAADYFELLRAQDGSFSLQRKETSWFGDERDGTEPAAEVRWEWWDAPAGVWQAYSPLSAAVLEEAFGQGLASASINDAAGGRGRVDLRAMEEVTAGIAERTVRRTRKTGRVEHRPEKLNAEAVQRLRDMEAFRRNTVSP